MKKKLVVLASGGGTNFQSIIDSVEAGKINGEITALISSNYTAYALTRAQNAGIKTYVCAIKDFADGAIGRDKKLLEILKAENPDYIILAGYLGVIPPEIVREFRDRIVNIHPALLPRHGGKGYYGINVHKAVIDAGDAFSGATVHFVDDGTDTGRIIAQESLPVKPDDTPESLQVRILEQIEHKLFPRVIGELCAEKPNE